MNMPLNIHFFRSSQKGRMLLDEVNQILDFFQERPNFNIYYLEDRVDIIYSDAEFQFQYEYKITKVSQIKAIYKLNKDYIYIKFMLCLPILIPDASAREVLGLAQTLAKQFDLAMYHEDFEDVKPFNMADIITLFYKKRQEYFEENPNTEKVFMDADELTTVCKYQRGVDNMFEFFHQELEVNLCEPIIDRVNEEFGICAIFNFGIPTVFVPYFKFVKINLEEGESFLVRREVFFKYMEKYLTKTENQLPDLYTLKKKQAKSSKNVLAKLKKAKIEGQEFVTMRLCDIIDKR